MWRGSCYFITPMPRLDDTYLNYHDSQLDFFFLVKWLRAQPLLSGEVAEGSTT